MLSPGNQRCRDSSRVWGHAVRQRGEAGGITTVTIKTGDSLIMDGAGTSKLFFVWPLFPRISRLPD